MVNPVDPKWLEILKASGWQTSALTFALVAFILLVKNDVVSARSDLWITVPALGAVISGSLALASLGDAIFRAYRPVDRLSQWRRVRKEQQEVREYIPYMTDHDKSIIGYLLHYNQKMFQHEIDGGCAAPLVSKGIIRMALRAGQAGEQRWVPFEVPDQFGQC